MVYQNTELHKFSIDKVSESDKKFYIEIINYCDSHNIEYNASQSIIFDLATKHGLEIFERVADANGYTRHNCKVCHKHEWKRNKFELASIITKAFLIDFGSWIWNWNDERNISIRRIWYLRYKQLVQILFLKDHHLKTKFNDYYAGLLSRELWTLVRTNPELYYSSFSVKDMSRTVWNFEPLGWKNIVVLGEKDATTPYFQETCRILGIQVLFSGKGKTSAAAVEVMYNDMVSRKFDHETPIYIFTLTDWDEDGLIGVESGFLKQVEIFAERFDYEIVHQRVGISPDDLEDDDKSPLKKCFELPKQDTTWARTNGIPFINDDGDTLYLGIELEALPTAYFYNRILESCYEYFTQEEMSDFIRQKHTPENYEYESEIEDLVKNHLQSNSYDYKKLEFQKGILQDKIYNLNSKQDDLVDPVKDDLWEKTKDIPEQADFDDRQREWDETVGDWNADSVNEMYDNHKTKIEASVKAQKPFNGYYEGLDFKSDQLIEKFRKTVDDMIQNGDLEIEMVNEDEFNANSDDYDAYVLPLDTTNNFNQTVEMLKEIGIVRSIFRCAHKLVIGLKECPNEDEIADTIDDEDFEVLNQLIQAIDENPSLLEESEEDEEGDEEDEDEDY